MPTDLPLRSPHLSRRRVLRAATAAGGLGSPGFFGQRVWVARDRDGLKQVASNLDGEYAHRACCVLGVCGGLIKDDRTTAAALTQEPRLMRRVTVAGDVPVGLGGRRSVARKRPTTVTVPVPEESERLLVSA